MEQVHLKNIRNSRMFLNEVYFWADTIKDWKHLLKEDEYKRIIIDQLQWLVSKKLIAVYGYVIMPNHIHLIWEQLQMNGKELPNASFNKWTSKCFLNKLKDNYPQLLTNFVEETRERKHRFWQRDPLAVIMDTREKFEQKLDYVHLNPLQEHWNLVSSPEGYQWSSANYYMNGIDEFEIMTHYLDRF
jgi:REP element-mobilizing transposase RayT